MLKKLRDNIINEMKSQNPTYLITGYIGCKDSTGEVVSLKQRLFTFSEDTLKSWLQLIDKIIE